jgi:putative hydrolase of the HAD superfamily
VKAVLFDFGGTLDADGIAWKDRFYACYRDQGLSVDEQRFARRFYDADDPLVGHLPESAGLDETVARLVDNLESGLGTAGDAPGVAGRGARVAGRFLADSRAALARNAPVLARLAQRYKLGIVSNFYGNLAAVCRDGGIAPYLGAMVDSTRVGAEKPSPAIFRPALDALGVDAADCLFVGDSLHRDRAGARAMGMGFVWIAPAAAGAAAGALPGERAAPSVAAIEGLLA